LLSIAVALFWSIREVPVGLKVLDTHVEFETNVVSTLVAFGKDVSLIHEHDVREAVRAVADGVRTCSRGPAAGAILDADHSSIWIQPAFT
jgi:hypothetical protein